MRTGIQRHAAAGRSCRPAPCFRLHRLIFFGAALLPAWLATGAAQAQQPSPLACPPPIAEIAECFSARDANGAYILAARPKNWNGDLVVFAHGGPAVEPPTASSSLADLTKYAIAVRRGYAWVASSYRREGYGVRMAGADTDMARRFFIDAIGKPRRTILHGVSYGGLVGAKLLEAHATDASGAKNYDGALLTSGLLTGAVRGYEFRVDLRAVYQLYCNNLPTPHELQYPLWMGVPASSKLDMKGLGALVDECTGVTRPAAERSEPQKRNLANITKVIDIPETLLVRHMQSAAFLFRDIVQMLGGRNPFSNEGIRYKGSDDDERLNREVARFAYDRSALFDLKADGEPLGALPIPAIALHSINDPQVMVEVQSSFRDAVRAAGAGDRLVQNFTDEREHSGQSAPELAAAFESLAHWIDKGEKPTPQSMAAGCETLRAAVGGPCRFHPDYQPKPFSTRFYPRAETR